MRKPLTEEQIAAFRAKLCAAAESLFASQGVPGVSMRQIAQKMGYSQTAAYRYFSNKSEILAAVRTAALHRFVARLEQAHGGIDARADARALGRAYLQFAVDEPDAYRLIFDVHQTDVNLYPDLVDATERARDCMTLYVQALVDEGLLVGDARHLGTLFWAGAHGLVMLHLTGLVPTQGELVDLHAALMRLLFRGALASLPAAPAHKTARKKPSRA
jgi:AcrR family transcriptional regulator